MISEELKKVREYEEAAGNAIPPEERPLFHLSPRVGWMNDPNGFSQYKGMFHLFYQYYPYAKKWGPMHWGHAVSKDLLKWEFLPAALAPDTDADRDGCFSGGAIELEDGRHMLMYTGVIKMPVFEKDTYLQHQCIAFGDGVNYTKIDSNPVISIFDLPKDTNDHDFRDPKVWREEDGSLACVVGNCTVDNKGRILYFKSKDGLKWELESILAENDGTTGRMWECPDFFALDGKYVLLLSPQDFTQTDKYYCGNNAIYMIGTYDKKEKKFIRETDNMIDCGIDFYATQSLKLEDGRTIMLGWMQNWDTITYYGEELKWIGQMTLPRELSIRNGKLYQKPIRELENLRRNPVIYKDVFLNGRKRLDKVEGRTIDLKVDVHPAEESAFSKFEIRFAEGKGVYTSLVYHYNKKKVSFDRTYCGSARAVQHHRECKVKDHVGKISIRLILDRYSSEIFINDGEKVLSDIIYTDQSCKGISFYADDDVLMDIEKYDLSFE